MSDTRYKNFGTPADRLLEELGELIQAICKARRFGMFAHDLHTGLQHNNLDAIRSEMRDVSDAMTVFEAELIQINFKYYEVPNENSGASSF